MLCKSYKVPSLSITRLFRLILASSALKLLNPHFLVKQDNWDNVDVLFTNCYDYSTKKEEK